MHCPSLLSILLVEPPPTDFALDFCFFSGQFLACWRSGGRPSGSTLSCISGLTQLRLTVVLVTWLFVGRRVHGSVVHLHFFLFFFLSFVSYPVVHYPIVPSVNWGTLIVGSLWNSVMRFDGNRLFSLWFLSFFLSFFILPGKDRGADHSRENLVQHRKSLARTQGWIFFGLVQTSWTVNNLWVDYWSVFKFQSEILPYFHVAVGGHCFWLPWLTDCGAQLGFWSLQKLLIFWC